MRRVTRVPDVGEHAAGVPVREVLLAGLAVAAQSRERAARHQPQPRRRRFLGRRASSGSERPGWPKAGCRRYRRQERRPRQRRSQAFTSSLHVKYARSCG